MKKMVHTEYVVDIISVESAITGMRSRFTRQTSAKISINLHNSKGVSS